MLNQRSTHQYRTTLTARKLYFCTMKLASEISTAGRRNIVSILTQQKTREAYLRMRGEMPMAIQSPFIPETSYDPEKVDLVRQCAIKAYCRPNGEAANVMSTDAKIITVIMVFFSSSLSVKS